MSDPSPRKTEPVGRLLRLLLPVGILGAGWFGFARLAEKVEKEPPPPAKELKLRTRVEELEVVDYPVFVKTNAMVQAHNPVTLAAEVPGVVTRVSPSFEAGAYFNQGDVLVELDDRDYTTALTIAKSRLAAAKSALELARLTEERKLRLIESNAVSQAEVDVASATREQREADVELAETEVERAELNLTRTRVVAPFEGRVRTKLIGVGQMTSANSPLGEVFAVDFVEVRLPISGDQGEHLNLPEFADDPPLDVTVRDAIVDTSNHAWQGRIVRTEGVLDENSRDVFAIARIDDPFGRHYNRPPLRIGQPVIASISGRTLNDVIALPRKGVRRLNEVVLVDPKKHTLLPMTIEPVWSDPDHVIVPACSLPVDMWLATSPLSYAPEGSTVEIIPATQSASTIADAGAAGESTANAN